MGKAPGESTLVRWLAACAKSGARVSASVPVGSYSWRIESKFQAEPLGFSPTRIVVSLTKW